MDPTRFDRLVASLVRPGSRRGLLRLLAAVPVVSLPLTAPPLPAPFATLFGEEAAAAKGQKQVGAARKKRKKKCARAGRPTTKKHKRCCPGLVKTGTICTRPSPPPSPPTPPPSCPPGGCPAKTVCHNGVCQQCDVTCSGTPAACGQALQAALSGGAPIIYVCPGRYQPSGAIGFSLNKTKTVIGAGQGTGAANNTILDANNLSRVLNITGSATVVLEQLRITDGNATGAPAGGIGHLGGTLRMTDCSVIGNTATGPGGGIFNEGGAPLEMTRCTVSGNSTTAGGPEGGGGIWANGDVTLTDCQFEDNHANNRGGGIYLRAGTLTLNGTTEVKDNTATQGGGIFAEAGTLTIAESCRVTNNTAAAANDGGGINNAGATVTLEGAGATSPIVVNNCHENCVGTVPKCAATPKSC
jgi:predicted outer membrane repeat protein